MLCKLFNVLIYFQKYLNGLREIIATYGISCDKFGADKHSYDCCSFFLRTKEACNKMFLKQDIQLAKRRNANLSFEYITVKYHLDPNWEDLEFVVDFDLYCQVITSLLVML